MSKIPQTKYSQTMDNDHPWHPIVVTVVDRLSLFRGTFMLYKFKMAAVTDRWSLAQFSLQDEYKFPIYYKTFLFYFLYKYLYVFLLVQCLITIKMYCHKNTFTTKWFSLPYCEISFSSLEIQLKWRILELSNENMLILYWTQISHFGINEWPAILSIVTGIYTTWFEGLIFGSSQFCYCNSCLK